MLVTVHRADGGRHVTEAALGTPLPDLLGGLAAGQVQAVLMRRLPRGAGCRPRRPSADPGQRGAAAGRRVVGAGVLAELPAGRCGLAETARVARYLALESAGQCGPCFNGLPRIAAALADLSLARPAPQPLADVRRWSGLVAGRGACHHPDGFTRFVASALAVFGPELERHARGQCQADQRPPVPAGAGRRRGPPGRGESPPSPWRAPAARRTGADMTDDPTITINPVTCTGHGLCAELLPELVTLDEWGYPLLAAARGAAVAAPPGRGPRPRGTARPWPSC